MHRTLIASYFDKVWRMQLALLFLSAGAIGQPLVQLRQDGAEWSLHADGRPFMIKGVVGNQFLEKVKEYGGNSIRAGWQKEQLDQAHKLGLKVLVNLPAKAERDGMNYDDTAATRKQTVRIISIVKELKDHPAVLMWAIGNELDYVPPLEPFDLRVWDAVNQAARAIHAIDPNHPVMTVIGTSMMHKVADIAQRCPELDLLGINTYGDIYTLSDTLMKYGWVKPYVITEWGPDGYWEVTRTPWGAPYEQTGLEKYECYKKKYLSAMDPSNKQCLGSYVFYWSGFKQETTHTWFCMFDKDGLESPLVGLMHYLWKGVSGKNNAPIVDSLNIGSFARYQAIVMDPGSSQEARVFATDPDGDRLSYRWEIRPEAVYASYAGQGEEVPEPLNGLITGQTASITLRAPFAHGPYRLFVYAYDDYGHFSTANLPFFVSPVPSDTADLGRYTSRTLNLLAQSTPEKRNTVKILVYGQSISAQDWWLRLKHTVKERFPNADLIMENRSIGGFAAQLLYKTVEMDVSTFYPDLVLLHIYGDPVYYDSVLYTIRSRTAAEVAIMTDHYTGHNSWSDTMSYHILPALTEKYKCDLINIRDTWKKYLEDHQLAPSKLLSDDVHLNDYGNLLMAELVKPLFVYRPQYPSDPFGLFRLNTFNQDLYFPDDTLILPFDGNKAEVIMNNQSGPKDTFRVLLDDRPPSAFRGTYFMSRPFGRSGKEWPWELPGMIQIRHTQPWLREDWTCTFTQAEPPYTDFTFSVAGSVTGEDGQGHASENFISPSGRVIIRAGDAGEGGDWHLNRSYQILKTQVKNGERIYWKTYSISLDSIPPHDDRDGILNYILFQGVPNSHHVLKLIKTGTRDQTIRAILIHKPFLTD